MASELVIKINGDIEGFKKSLTQVESETEKLGDSLNSMGKAAGVAFAALTAEAFFAVKAYAEQEAAVNKLSTALGTQGIYSKQLVEEYRAQASALQDLTGADDDAIIRGQAFLQSQIGAIPITKELTKAVVDFAVATGQDLESAFQIVGKTIGSNTNALARQGIEVDVNASKQEKLRQVTEALERRFKGQGEAAVEGLGQIRRLTNAFEDMQKAIGERLAPVVSAGAKNLANLINAISNNKPIMDLVVSLGAAGLVFTGTIATVAALSVGFTAFSSALAAAGVTMSATTVAARTLMGATGLGLLVVLASEIALNWNSVWPQMQAVFQAFVNNVTTAASGLGMVLQGVFTLNTELITEGFAKAKSAFTVGFEEYKTLVEASRAEMDAAEAEAEKAKEDEKNANEALKVDKHKQFLIDVAAQENAIREEQNKKEVRDTAAANVLEFQTAEKHGKALAQLERALNSSKVTEAQGHFGAMANLQRSNNATLKSIGKAFAIAQITMNTATSAMGIYKWFAETVPFIGHALGIAAAASAVAFGAEQIGQVISAADGGLITGGTPGRDSVPAMLMPGELVVPTNNFEEVVSAVANQRTGGGEGAGSANITVQFVGDLAEIVEAKIMERQNLGVSLLPRLA